MLPVKFTSASSRCCKHQEASHSKRNMNLSLQKELLGCETKLKPQRAPANQDPSRHCQATAGTARIIGTAGCAGGASLWERTLVKSVHRPGDTVRGDGETQSLPPPSHSFDQANKTTKTCRMVGHPFISPWMKSILKPIRINPLPSQVSMFRSP